MTAITMSAPAPHDQVSRLAYQIYLGQGQPDGRAAEHWLAAETLLRHASSAPLSLRCEPDCTRVEILAPRLLGVDEEGEGKVRIELKRMAEALPRPNLVLDLARVEHVCSEMLGALVALNRRVHQKGGGLRLVNVRPTVRQELMLCRLDRVLDVEPDRPATAGR